MNVNTSRISGNASWEGSVDSHPPPHYDAEFGLSDGWSRRHYWQALLLMSVGLSLLLGAFVFLMAALSARQGRCTPSTAGAAAATLSSLVLVVLLMCTKAVSVDIPEYE